METQSDNKVQEQQPEQSQPSPDTRKPIKVTKLPNSFEQPPQPAPTPDTAPKVEPPKVPIAQVAPSETPDESKASNTKSKLLITPKELGTANPKSKMSPPVISVHPLVDFGLTKNKADEYVSKGMPSDFDGAYRWLESNGTSYFRNKVAKEIAIQRAREGREDVIEEVVINKIPKPKRQVKKIVEKYDSADTEEEVIEEVVKIKKPKRKVKKIVHEYVSSDSEDERRVPKPPTRREMQAQRDKDAIDRYNMMFGDM